MRKDKKKQEVVDPLDLPLVYLSFFWFKTASVCLVRARKCISISHIALRT